MALSIGKRRATLEQAIVFLEIALGRMEACHEKHPEEHQVSVKEVPDWIAHLKGILDEWPITPDESVLNLSKQNNLTNDEIIRLGEYLPSWTMLDKSSTTTTAGVVYSYMDHCQMAYLMWQRLGKHDGAFTVAWNKFMQNNASIIECMQLVAYYVLENHPKG